MPEPIGIPTDGTARARHPGFAEDLRCSRRPSGHQPCLSRDPSPLADAGDLVGPRSGVRTRLSAGLMILPPEGSIDLTTREGLCMFQGAFRRAVSTSGSVWVVLILASCTSGSGSATTSGRSSATGANSITYPRVVDLSQVISPSIPLWPGDPHVVFKVVATMNKSGYHLRSYTIGEHSATHM